MKKINFILLMFIVTIFLSCSEKKSDNPEVINPILGDISFISKFGYQPDASANEDVRIKTHLEFVENLLRQKDVSNLPSDLRKKRSHLLDLLHEYWTREIFPRNYDYAGTRNPCFIDKDEKICAVGYLIEQTAGRAIAEEINIRHKYDRVLAMNESTVDSWISGSGLSKEECAMIQPTYGPPPENSENYITPSYGIGSGIFIGFNTSMLALNASEIRAGTENYTIPSIGVATGLTQVALGVGNLQDVVGHETGYGQEMLSVLNIAFGSLTTILSVWNLIDYEKPKVKLTSVKVFNYQAHDHTVGAGISVTRRF